MRISCAIGAAPVEQDGVEAERRRVAEDRAEVLVVVHRFEDHDAQYVRDGPTTLLSWREHNLAFALIGDLDLKELSQIATSVIP